MKCTFMKETVTDLTTLLFCHQSRNNAVSLHTILVAMVFITHTILVAMVFITCSGSVTCWKLVVLEKCSDFAIFKLRGRAFAANIVAACCFDVIVNSLLALNWPLPSPHIMLLILTMEPHAEGDGSAQQSHRSTLDRYALSRPHLRRADALRNVPMDVSASSTSSTSREPADPVSGGITLTGVCCH